MASKSSFYDNLLQISQGKLEIFTEATDAFVQTSEDADISFEQPPQESSPTE